ncbi:MAG: DUF5340 domain-containing protein [Leptolyngbya sp. SIO4C5]|uniref:DUF5340 family protein n=1 Tax=Sphaerothrix gracilis TaxID=3151835 RepID=UPI0013BF8DB1|nr:DUF5340 domain-containing protein [Leptolyngbya sp. SIO4C5]
MDRPIPLPSHIHYELLLQLLERQTLFSLQQRSSQQQQIQELIFTLRKALSQQKQLEESCRSSGIAVEYHWSLNDATAPSAPHTDEY